MRVFVLALLAAVACGAPLDRAAVARDVYAKSRVAVAHGVYGRAAGLLLALRSPQLAPFRPRGADALEHVLAEFCARPVRTKVRWVEEPPVVDAWYVWPFDGTYWIDELEGYRVREDEVCATAGPRGR